MRAAAASVIVLAMLSPVACGEAAAPVPRDESQNAILDPGAVGKPAD